MSRIFKTPSDGHYFFGYYDKSPLNFFSDKLLACKANFIDKFPSEEDILEIGYFDWKNSNSFIKLTDTRAWNWQQGCMLQWFGPGHKDKIIYNDRIKQKFVTILLDIKLNKKTILPMAYYSASSDGDFLLCIDNERHCWYRKAYSYQGIYDLSKKVPILKNDGIWKIDVQTNSKKQIISLGQMMKFEPLSNMADATHYLEHLMINPNNKRFGFLHRWKTNDGGIYARLFTSDVDGENIYLLNDSGRMSHFCWKNENQILGWGGISNPINSLRKYKNSVNYLVKPLMPIYKYLVRGDSVVGNSKISSLVTGDGYIIFTDQTKHKNKKNVLKRIDRDGHPSFSKNNENLMITDTYPDLTNDHVQQLILCDFKKEKITIIDTLKHNKELSQGASRCDLHPKWSFDGKLVCIDTLDEGYRSMYLYNIF